MGPRDRPGRELTTTSGDVHLAGELWLPSGAPIGTLLMVPGSGPSDRHNDVFFPPIRRHLVAAGFAVASFDKRGVGGSSGDWRGAGIEAQAADALAAVDALVELEPLRGLPIGLYGHSQGGWVVLDSASRDRRVAFVVANSGPGVSPVEQERFAAGDGLRRMGLPAEEVAAALAEYQAMYDMLERGDPYAVFRRWVDADDVRRRRFRQLGQVAFMPGDEGTWGFGRLTVTHDPRPTLERIECPILALFGAEDRLVPVDESVRSYRAHARDVTIRVFDGADHRCQVGDPPGMAPGYLDALAGWLLDRLTRRSPIRDATTPP